MHTDFASLAEAGVRTAFVAFVLWVFAQNFDFTELMVIGLYVIMEGAFLYWRAVH